MKSRGGSKRTGKAKTTARKARVVPSGKAKRPRGSKRPKSKIVKTAPQEIRKRVIKHGEAVEYLGGEKTMKKGRHKIVETGPLTIGKKGIKVVSAVVDALEKLPPSTKLSYNLEVRFNDKAGKRKSVTLQNIAIPTLQNIKLSKTDKRKKRTKKSKWLSIVYGRLRERIFQPIVAEFGFVSANRVPKKGIRNRAKVIQQIERFRKNQDTRFKLVIQREIF